MNIAGISSTDPISGSISGQAGSQELDKDAFMQLLVAQMENQDPLEPTDNTEYVAQLAQFTELEQMEQLNDNVVGLAVLQQGNALLQQLTDGSALIDKAVSFLDPDTGVESQGIVSSIKIVDGSATLNIDGADVPLGNVLEVTGGLDSDSAGTDGEDGSGESA